MHHEGIGLTGVAELPVDANPYVKNSQVINRLKFYTFLVASIKLICVETLRASFYFLDEYLIVFFL